MNTFPYSVQLAHDGKTWNTIAKTVDQHKAEALAFSLHEEGHDAVRVRLGTKVVATFRGEK